MKILVTAFDPFGGTYVCNHLMYGILNYIHKNKLNIKAGFNSYTLFTRTSSRKA